MADGKQWFRVWTSILTDPGHSALHLEDVGRWVRLGALIAQHGDHGTLVIEPPALVVCALFGCAFEDLSVVLGRLPNVSTEACRDAEKRHGAFTVTLRNWWKYQLDSTAAKRQKLRRQSRTEQNRTDPPLPPPRKRRGGTEQGLSGSRAEKPSDADAAGGGEEPQRFGAPGEGMPRSVAAAIERAERVVVGDVPRETPPPVVNGYRL